jgi:ketosteroid isomerase-like protein
MKRIGVVVFALAVLLPITAQAQEWTTEQQEVWAWEQSCWESNDLEFSMTCFHEDFVGWGGGNFPAPTSKADRRATFARSFETTDVVWRFLKPLHIKVHGDVAVLIYIAVMTEKNKATGEETTSTELWTDIALKENGTWAWIADHGTPVEDDD